MTTLVHDEKSSRELSLVLDYDVDDFTRGRFAELVVERALEHAGSTSWATEEKNLDPLARLAVATQRSPFSRTAVLDLGDAVADGCLAHASLRRGRLYLGLAGRTPEDLAAARSWFRELFPPVRASEEQRVSISFWSLSQRGVAREITRRIDVPTWGEVTANYPAAVASRLATVMSNAFVPGRGGRLLLWHGPPGTGKTFALRALAWEWRSWCDIHYVTDPESFFGASPTYMLDVLLDEDDEDEAPDRWRLLILEDTGELLAADAKERTGQGLSRLLNTVDGLIGQGLRVLVLVTTNEKLKSLHSAVSRPGRCASQIEFAAFTAEEAAEWLASRGGEPQQQAATLASLYASEEGLEQPAPRPIGFTQ